MLTILDIKRSSKGKLIQGDRLSRVKGVSINTRTIRRGDLFIAIKGLRFDGHRFVSQAIKKGAKALVVSKRVKAPKSAAVILVKDTTKALGHIAHCYRRQFDIPVIAITGSAGKTTTKEMIASVLKSKYNVLKNKMTENNQFGVPLTLLQLKRKHQILVIEFGTNQFGDISWLAKITEPSVGVFTNIGEAHLQGLKTKGGVFREKFSLVRHMPKNGAVIYNSDDAVLNKIRHIKIPQRKISFGINQKAHFRAEQIAMKNQRIFFKVRRHQFMLSSMANHNIYNALAAISCGSLFKIPYNNITTSIKKFRSEIGRFQALRFGSLQVIDDTYNANPLSLKSAVNALGMMPKRGKRIVVCADMLELGKQSARLHQQMGRWLAQKEIDCLLTFGNHAKYISKTLARLNNGKLSTHYHDRNRLHQRLKSVCQPGDIVLVKGSRSMQMEQTVHYLKKLKL